MNASESVMSLELSCDVDGNKCKESHLKTFHSRVIAHFGKRGIQAEDVHYPIREGNRVRIRMVARDDELIHQLSQIETSIEGPAFNGILDNLNFYLCDEVFVIRDSITIARSEPKLKSKQLEGKF